MPGTSESSEKTPETEVAIARCQNSYRLEAHNPFKTDPVDRIVKMVMINNLEDITYDSTEVTKVCEAIATDIRKRIIKLNFDRYKIVVLVSIIEKASQSFETSFEFLWDSQKDNYSTFAYESRTFHASCCVFEVAKDESIEEIAESVEELREQLANMKRLMEERKDTTLGEISRGKRKKNSNIIDGNFLSWVFGLALVVILSVSVYAFYSLYDAVLRKFPSHHTEL